MKNKSPVNALRAGTIATFFKGGALAATLLWHLASRSAWLLLSAYSCPLPTKVEVWAGLGGFLLGLMPWTLVPCKQGMGRLWLVRNGCGSLLTDLENIQIRQGMFENTVFVIEKML